MIKARNNKILRFAWSIFSKYGIKLYFADLKLFNTIKTNFNESILLLPNHFSWWDGFIAYRINDILFKKSYYVMMLQKNLQLNQFLRGAGAFSIEKNSRSMLETFHYTEELLSKPNNLVVIFPQGSIESIQAENISFETGVVKILKRNKLPVQVILMTVLIEYLDKPKPTIFVFTKKFEGDSENLKDAFLTHHKESKRELAEYVKNKMR